MRRQFVGGKKDVIVSTSRARTRAFTTVTTTLASVQLDVIAPETGALHRDIVTSTIRATLRNVTTRGHVHRDVITRTPRVPGRRDVITTTAPASLITTTFASRSRLKHNVITIYLT